MNWYGEFKVYSASVLQWLKTAQQVQFIDPFEVEELLEKFQIQNRSL